MKVPLQGGGEAYRCRREGCSDLFLSTNGRDAHEYWSHDRKGDYFDEETD